MLRAIRGIRANIIFRKETLESPDDRESTVSFAAAVAASRSLEESKMAFSPYLGSKEMERKLIGAVNVNTRMDVRDRKSGLVNWLTVSPSFSLSLSSDSFHRLSSETTVSPSRSRYLLALPSCLAASPSFLLLPSPSHSSGSPPTELSARTRRSILHLADSLDF